MKVHELETLPPRLEDALNRVAAAIKDAEQQGVEISGSLRLTCQHNGLMCWVDWSPDEELEDQPSAH